MEKFLQGNCLNLETLNKIEKLNLYVDNDFIDETYSELIFEAYQFMKLKERGCFIRVDSPSELNDCDSDDCVNEYVRDVQLTHKNSFHETSLSCDDPVKKTERIDERRNSQKEFCNESVDVIKHKLMKFILTESCCIPQISRLLSNVDNESMIEILAHAWAKLQDCEKDKLIIAISSIDIVVILFCRKILLPWVIENKDSSALPDILKPVFSWLRSHAIMELVIPLLDSEDSPFLKDLHLLKDVTQLMSEEQRNLLIKEIIEKCTVELKPSYIPGFSVLLENGTFCEIYAERLLSILETNVVSYSQDRNMGKLLFTFIQTKTSQTSPAIIKRINNVIDKFKGLMHFRLKKLLRSLSSNTTF